VLLASPPRQRGQPTRPQRPRSSRCCRSDRPTRPRSAGAIALRAMTTIGTSTNVRRITA